ncbi:MAG: MBL fold metallo-hydrolase [bacterium]|nr:MBL fold metallo-hydrolase [bacterium]
MIVTYHGNQQFKFQLGDMVIAVNPISKDSNLKGAKFGADICLISVQHPDFNGADQVSFGEKQPFVVSGPGEYEIKGVFIKGFPSKSNYDGEERNNTIYTFNLDSLNVCFLGGLSDLDISAEAKQALEELDLLFVPIGGNGVLNAQDAYKLAVKLEPKAIIPMGYDGGEKDALKIFIKEGGEDVKPIDKLTIKKKDLEGKETDIIILSTS